MTEEVVEPNARMKNPNQTPSGGWVIHAVINGLEYRVPERGSAASFNELVAALRKLSENAGSPLGEEEAISLTHEIICRNPLVPCWKRQKSPVHRAVSAGTVPFQQRVQRAAPAGTRLVRGGRKGGCCGGGRRR